jgi:spermidine synthase
VSWLFLLAYTASGLAGLIYEVSWTRLVTLLVGHTTAAASAVVAAFLGGLAVGAAFGGRVASGLAPPRSLRIYIGLELFVVVAAVLLPFELDALTPLLRWAYADGEPGWLFPGIRLVSCLGLVCAPAAALGATFPMAIRWFARESPNPARAASVLYVLNTVGAAAGSLLAGFVLIPAIGVSGTVGVGMAASLVAAAAALGSAGSAGSTGSPDPAGSSGSAGSKRERRQAEAGRGESSEVTPPWVAVAVLALSGFAMLVHEIAWTRILSLVLGPTTYAVAATLAAVITGIAAGAGIGARVVGRSPRPAGWLVGTLALGAVGATWTYSVVGGPIPRLVAARVARSPTDVDRLLVEGVVLAFALILPTAVLVGAAFPLALAISHDPAKPAARRFGLVYALNTIGAVTGALAAGFLLIPWLGLQSTVRVVSASLIAAAAVVLVWGTLRRPLRVAGLAGAALAALLMMISPPWDRELLASGVYLYAPFVPRDLDLEAMLKAGTLLYYREGAAATVTVKRLTGTTTLAVDGKTDASNRGDMLTQKLIAHLPLLLHESPRQVAIVGLGSGATIGAALRHPIDRADVVEISPEVVEASRFFLAENGDALKDPRAHLIVGDGRSHLLLARRRYDVIISEPSNPWIAGVAALFTREFFEAARDRLTAGGLMCQWANAYNISDADLRAIVATFRSVFPDGTVWLVGESDVVLVGSVPPATPPQRVGPRALGAPAPGVEARLGNIEHNWTRPGVADDLATLGVVEPFSVWSLFVGGPGGLEGYAGGAPIFTDDRMTLEFSAPREIHRRVSGSDNTGPLMSLMDEDGWPDAIRQARERAGAAQWRNRGVMLARADAHTLAYDAFAEALRVDPLDGRALDGLVDEAILLERAGDALARIDILWEGREPTPELGIARSKLLAATGARAAAVDEAAKAALMQPARPEALEQLAALHAEAGDAAGIDAVVERLRQRAPERPGTHYYAAVAAFLRGAHAEALERVQKAVAADSAYAPAYDLMGAAYTKLGQGARARQAFETSLALNARDSTAYANLGLLELAAGHREGARRYFAEALWLDPESATARSGLAATGQ